ncbi:MAG: heavy-metal-associated domain-containing protein [Nitrospirae bacterium]|nr:heavy-metal-associated domain-containing protein [Nitrospirota bacterium]
MKQGLIIFALIAAVFAGAAQGAFAAEKSCTLEVAGMTCDSCVKHVQDALKKVDGVKTSNVDIKGKSASVVFLDDKTSPEKLADAVTKAGYEAKVKK